MMSMVYRKGDAEKFVFSDADPYIPAALRSYLNRIGYSEISIRRHFVAPYYVVTAWNPIDDDYLLLQLNVDEMTAITKAGRVFWRYIK